MKEHDAFISYESDEFETADWVCFVLETNSITCRMAPADIPGGSSYAISESRKKDSPRRLNLFMEGYEYQ